MKALYIHGMIRSGTNAIEELIEMNLHVDVVGRFSHSWCWKHGPYNEGQHHRHILISGRNIFQWLISSFRLCKLNGCSNTKAVSLSEYIDSPINIDWKSHMYKFQNPIEYYNCSYGQWISCNNGNYEKMLIRNEDLIEDQKSILIDIADRFNLNWKGTFKPLIKEAGPSQFCREKDRIFKSGDSIRKRRFMDLFSPGEVDFINSKVDPDVIEKLGYSDFHCYNMQTLTP